MKGLTRATFALLASAALGFAQTNSMPAPAGPMQYPQNSTYNVAPSPRPQPGMASPGMGSPGMVNYIEGQVTVDNRPLSSSGPVVMQPGQALATANGFAEILLTPGAFLRVGPHSQIRLISSGLADTRAQLDRGTAMVEVDQFIKSTNLAILVKGATAQIDKQGLYDFDADQQAIRVLDGKLTVSEAGGTKSIGRDEQLLLASAKPLKARGSNPQLVKAEPLYVWSEARSQAESQANVALAQNFAAYGGWFGPGWYWDPYWSFYSYLPGDGFFYSPFGWGFFSPGFVGYYGGFRYGHFGHYAGYGHVAGVNGVYGAGFHAAGFHGGGGRR